MTQRRPLWDADLFYAVYDAALKAYDDGLDGGAYDTLPIIAVVEDWQARRLGASAEQLNRIADWQWMKVSIPLWHWAQAEAAIQRVRQLCQSAIDESYLTDASIARAGLANRILRALDGAS